MLWTLYRDGANECFVQRRGVGGGPNQFYVQGVKLMNIMYRGGANEYYVQGLTYIMYMGRANEYCVQGWS